MSACCEHRHHGHDQPRVELDRPDEERHSCPRHPARTKVVDRHDEVHRAGDRGHGDQVEREDPVVLPVARRVNREWRICRPARVRSSAVGEEAQHEHEATEDEEPVREGVQPRERHVGRPDHERHEVVREAGENRNADEKHHRRPVDRDELVVVVRADDARVRLGELQPHDQCHQSREDEEDEAGGDVEDPDPLVIRRDEPARHLPALPAGHGFRASGHSAGSL